MDARQEEAKDQGTQEEGKQNKQLLDEIQCLRIASNSIMAQMSNISHVLRKQDKKKGMTQQTEPTGLYVAPSNGCPRKTQEDTRKSGDMRHKPPGESSRGHQERVGHRRSGQDNPLQRMPGYSRGPTVLRWPPAPTCNGQGKCRS